MIIENVSFPGGKHCETTTLGALLRHVGIDLSEPMLFGLGAGLGFAYWDAKTMAFPFLGGRIKPAALTRNLASRLGLTMQAQETTSVRAAWRNVAAAIDAGSPVGLQLDSYHLDYFTTRIHFGAHFVAMYGYDDTYANLGHRGIRKAAGQVTKWLERSADPRRDLTLAASLMERGGTGGALFRAMYRDFLGECTTIVDDDNLRLGHRRYAEIAPLWTRVAAHIAAAGETGEEHHLRTAATILLDLAEREREAMQALAGVGT